jgi:hypothetical protein
MGFEELVDEDLGLVDGVWQWKPIGDGGIEAIRKRANDIEDRRNKAIRKGVEEGWLEG